MGHFLSDKKVGEIGEKIAQQILGADFQKAPPKTAGYDFRASSNGKTIEVKFDKMSEETNNLAFEVSNGTKLTGVFASEADEIWYIAPLNGKYKIFRFNREKLIKWLKSSTSVRSVNGGDKKKFSLILAKITDVEKYIDILGEMQLWVEPQE